MKRLDIKLTFTAFGVKNTQTLGFNFYPQHIPLECPHKIYFYLHIKIVMISFKNGYQKNIVKQNDIDR